MIPVVYFIKILLENPKINTLETNYILEDNWNIWNPLKN